jgi:hypothetical protein
MHGSCLMLAQELCRQKIHDRALRRFKCLENGEIFPSSSFSFVPFCSFLSVISKILIIRRFAPVGRLIQRLSVFQSQSQIF